MLKYLVILIDKSATSFCHYDNICTEHELMPLDTLKAGILFGMKENLNIQFVYPDYELPVVYQTTIDSIDHIDIKPSTLCEGAEIVVFDGWGEIENFKLQHNVAYVLRTSKEELFANYAQLNSFLRQSSRINVVITDIETFSDDDLERYNSILDELSETIKNLYINGATPQINLLTDRMMLETMNNCNAGVESVTLAPDGKFYVCPAFYHATDEEDFGLGKTKHSIGDVWNGVDIKNPQLYRLDHAPLCRNCDAYQCKRCVWLNRKTTYEINTPSHEQCVVAHLERNASRKLLVEIRKHGTFLPEKPDIKEINYLDPFNKRKEW